MSAGGKISLTLNPSPKGEGLDALRYWFEGSLVWSDKKPRRDALWGVRLATGRTMGRRASLSMRGTGRDHGAGINLDEVSRFSLTRRSASLRGAGLALSEQ